jgi:chromobox protein 1
MVTQGKLMLTVKWKGYDDPADQTLEPEDGLLYGESRRLRQSHRIARLTRSM